MDVPFVNQGTFAQPAIVPINGLHHTDPTCDLSKVGMDGQDASTASTSTPSQLSILLSVRLLMGGKEVGSIIGKRGDHIKFIREKSGAKINISDGSCAERIVTITGNPSTIHNAFQLIAQKFEEDMQAFPNGIPKPPITMRLIIPATQCGSIIGKGGIKIKEIREKTGASIQVASEMLPNSTERAVTISGACGEALVDCMKQICIILQEAPPKGATLPFRPKPNYNPMLIANSVAASVAAQQQQNQILQQLQAQQQNQQTTNALMQNMLQYGQSAPIYSLVQQPTNAATKSNAAAYPQFPGIPANSLPDIQNALLGNLALNNNALQLAQQYPLSIEDMQSALLGNPSLAAAMMSWPVGIDPASTDLFAQLPVNFANQQTIAAGINAGSGKAIADGMQAAGPIHKVNSTSSRSSTNSVTNGSRRFAPY